MLTRRNTSSSNIHSENATLKPYNLNKTKALRKKGDNRNMQHLTAELKLGKNLVITLSTAVYELAKQATPPPPPLPIFYLFIKTFLLLSK
jgi:hypothetical protein